MQRFALISQENFERWLKNVQAVPGGEMLASFLVGLMVPDNSNTVSWATLEQIAASVQQEKRKPATGKPGPGRPKKTAPVEPIPAESIEGPEDFAYDCPDEPDYDLDSLDHGEIGPDTALEFRG